MVKFATLSWAFSSYIIKNYLDYGIGCDAYDRKIHKIVIVMRMLPRCEIIDLIISDKNIGLLTKWTAVCGRPGKKQIQQEATWCNFIVSRKLMEDKQEEDIEEEKKEKKKEEKKE